MNSLGKCLVAACISLGKLVGQTVCPPTPAWSTCDLVFDLAPGENAANAQLRAEFRSPQHRTYLMYAFRDSDQRLIIRVAPTMSGTWEYRLTSNLPRFEGKEGQFLATDSDSPGFVRVANVHHFQTEANHKQHLWMASELDSLVKMPRTDFERVVAQRAAEKFTHLRVAIAPGDDLREAADRLRAINAKGMVADLALASIPADRAEREHYIADIVSRFAPMNLTWMGIPSFEDVAHAREILKDTGMLIKKYDPYDHPRTTLASGSSAALLGDGWMTMIDYGTPDANIGAVEHQLYQSPAINSGIKNEHDLWTATMNGQYPSCSATGSAAYMTAWFDFMSGNRYWELEPYFAVDGGRAIALEGIEYIVYVEKAGPIEVTVEKHGYDVAWINPSTGERIKEKKGYNGEHFTGEPPDGSHPWILHISREGTKEGMLKSYKFESRTVPVQEIEQTPEKTPFEIALPEKNDISIKTPAYYAIKVKRETRGTRFLLIEWTLEAVVNGEGYRVVGSGREGTLHVSPLIANQLPAVGTLRVAILNANGKAYVVDKVVRIVP